MVFGLGQLVLTQAALNPAQESAQPRDNSQEEAWMQHIFSGGHARSIGWTRPDQGSCFQGWRMRPGALYKCRSKQAPRPHFPVILPFSSLELKILLFGPHDWKQLMSRGFVSVA